MDSTDLRAVNTLRARSEAELLHLFSLLEAEPGWSSRESLPEPLRSQCRAYADFIREARPRLLENQQLTAQIEAGPAPDDVTLSEMADLVEANAISSVPLRDTLRGIINELRSARGAVALDGAESVTN